MSRLKRFGIPSGIVLVMLGGASLLWYQARYAQPLAAPVARVLPSDYSPTGPNGFDTLKEARELLEEPRQKLQRRHGAWYEERMAENKRFLAANQPFLTKIRQALAQPFLASAPYPYDWHHFQYWDQLQMLGLAYIALGEQSEAMRCALDIRELGAVVPSGGDFYDRGDGYGYEARGRTLAWFLAERVDAAVAREAVARLEAIEKRRWPLPESLREELRRKQLGSRLNAFQRGPLVLWRSLSSDRSVRGREEPKYLWEQVGTVLGGPQSLMDSWENWVERAQERLEKPWTPDRPALVPNPEVDPITGAVGRDLYGLSDYLSLEREEYLCRADTALLRTYLMLRAYQQEQGGYPDSLEGLVAKGYLKAVPTDPFSPTRAPLRYRREEGGAAFGLWSVGPDAKDDNGESLQAESLVTLSEKRGDVVANQTFSPSYGW